ncbi:MAG: arginase family protein, partial [Myxococcales bacterium]|nr:arginase family protein [Myxococcales bacterium]
MPDAARDRATLERILRPAGGGVYVVSTGLAEQQALMRAIYGAEDVQAGWAAALDRLAGARVVLLGVPSDVGAGFTRGANRAPAALRQHMLGHRVWQPDVLDLGDVRVVPQLLSDDMLGEAQIQAHRGRALRPESPVVRGTAQNPDV